MPINSSVLRQFSVFLMIAAIGIGVSLSTGCDTGTYSQRMKDHGSVKPVGEKEEAPADDQVKAKPAEEPLDREAQALEDGSVADPALQDRN